MKLIPLFVIVGLLASSAARGDSCDTVYASSTRNITSDESSYSSLHAIYDNYCSSTGEKNSNNASINLDTVVKQIPLKFSGASGSSSDKISAFCKNYQSIRYSSAWQNLKLDQVSVEALSQYNLCRSIEAKYGVKITHSFANPGSLLIHFEFANSFTDFNLQFVSTGPNLTCGTTAFSKDGKWKILGKEGRSIKSNFEILCERTGSKQKDGNVRYAATWVGVGTNLGAYSIPIEADSLYNNELASASTQRISKLQQDASLAQNKVVELTSLTSQLQAKINGLRIENHTVEIGQYHPGGSFAFFGCGTDINMVKNSMCAGAQLSTATWHSSRSGEMCGYNHWVISCVYVGN